MPFEVTFTLIDSGRQKTNLQFNLGQFGYVEGDLFEFSLVKNAVDNLRSAIESATKARVTHEIIRYKNQLSSLLPDSECDIADEVAVSIALDVETGADVQLRIPSPIDEFILSDKVTVDTSYPDMGAFLQAVVDHVRFGVGGNVEAVDPPQVTNAYVRSVARKKTRRGTNSG